jgi:rhomboid protease GluP
VKWFKKIQYNSPVVLSFALASFVSLLLGYLTRGWTTQLFFCVYRSSLLNPFTYIRLFGHILGHANLEHYTGNILLILLIGPMLEEKYGSEQLIKMIGITALVTGILNSLFFSTALLGASGIVYMMIVLSSMVSIQTGKVPLTLIITVLIYLGQEVVAGLFSTDSISQMTHIIGGIVGGVFGALKWKKPNIL